jgi:hypothetical protein
LSDCDEDQRRARARGRYARKSGVDLHTHFEGFKENKIISIPEELSDKTFEDLGETKVKYKIKEITKEISIDRPRRSDWS